MNLYWYFHIPTISYAFYKDDSAAILTNNNYYCYFNYYIT